MTIYIISLVDFLPDSDPLYRNQDFLSFLQTIYKKPQSRMYFVGVNRNNNIGYDDDGKVNSFFMSQIKIISKLLEIDLSHYEEEKYLRDELDRTSMSSSVLTLRPHLNDPVHLLSLDATSNETPIDFSDIEFDYHYYLHKNHIFFGKRNCDLKEALRLNMIPYKINGEATYICPVLF